MCIGDASVANPCAASYSLVAMEEDSAARLNDDQKRAARRAHAPDACDFAPLSHESYGRLARPATEHLNKLADTADRSETHVQ